MTAPVAHYGAGDLTFNRSQSTVSSIAVDKPANLGDGDLLVIIVGFQSNSAAASPGAPDGFTRQGPAYNTSGDSNRRPSGVYTKPILDASAESSTYTFTSANSASRAAIVAFRVTGADLDSPVQTSGAWFTPSNDASQDRAVPEVTATGDALLVSFVWWQTASSTGLSTTWTSPASEVADVATNTGAAATHSVLSVAVDTVEAGATGTRTATLSGSSTVANGSGYIVALGEQPDPVTTDMRCILHRGIVAAEQPATDEQSITGLEAAMTVYPWINGVEIDARISSDGVPYLMHDETFERVFPEAPDAETTGVEDCTAEELGEIGVTSLRDYLAAAKARHFDSLLVQCYTPATEEALEPVVEECLDSGYADRIVIMTAVSTSPVTAMEVLRDLGWTERIGMYGATASNWSTYDDAAAEHGLHVAFAPPGAYDSNRDLAAVLANDGIECGASTENVTSVMVHAETDGCRYVLTDSPAAYAARFIAPDNEDLPTDPDPEPGPARAHPMLRRGLGGTFTLDRTFRL